MYDANHNLIWALDDKKRNVFGHAILNRQEGVVKLLLEEAGEQMRMSTIREDVFGNNMLHQAAKSGPCSNHDYKFGAALQMQKEIQWFQVIHHHPTVRNSLIYK